MVAAVNLSWLVRWNLVTFSGWRRCCSIAIFSYQLYAFEAGGPVLWDILSTLFARMFSSVKVPSQFKVELILPLFKGKGLEAHNKDNYLGIAMFSVFCNVFEMKYEMPDLVLKRRTQLRVMVNAGLQGGVPWLKGTSGRNKSLAQMKEREKCKKNEPSPTSMRQMVLEIFHFKVRNLSNMDVAIL